MADKVITPEVGLKGCMFTCGMAFLILILSAVGYLIYVYYLDDSIPS